HRQGEGAVDERTRHGRGGGLRPASQAGHGLWPASGGGGGRACRLCQYFERRIMSATPQTGPLKLGFIALTDCAPLVVAEAFGLFEAEGLDVTLSREASWANIRDKVVSGALDGAHMLAPMALACTVGAGAPATPMIAPLALNANGSSI